MDEGQRERTKLSFVAYYRCRRNFKGRETRSWIFKKILTPILESNC